MPAWLWLRPSPGRELTPRPSSSPRHIGLAVCRYEFLFEDGTTYKKPTALSAPQYVDALMTWVQGLLDDEEVFPSRIGQSQVSRAISLPPDPPIRSTLLWLLCVLAKSTGRPDKS